MRIVLAFDSFKGSLSAFEACAIARQVLEERVPGCEVVEKPMADGGEGTARVVMAAAGGVWRAQRVQGPLPDMQVDAGYAWLPDRSLAVVEMAAASGLPLLPPARRNPWLTTTFGTGQLLQAALADGARKVWLAVGGSATVDGGVGAAMALGWRFLDARGQPVDGAGGCLLSIRDMQPPSTVWPEMEVLSDVTNPFCGPSGAARVFGPQKGAPPDMTDNLDRGLEHLADLLDRRGIRVRDLPGAGAAGGLAGGAVGFFGARIVPGIDRVMEACGLAEALRGADWAITGEGSFDSQSLQGKVVSGVLRRAGESRARVAVVAGDIRLSEADWRAAGVDRVSALRRGGLTVEDAIRSAPALFRERMREVAAGLV